MKDYNIQLGLTHEDIMLLFSGEISAFNFVPTEDTDYNGLDSLTDDELIENGYYRLEIA